MRRPWHIASPEPETVRQLAADLQIDPITSAVLVNRGFKSAKTASDFLMPTFRHIQPPQSVKDIHIAAERLARALRDREKILIFGDYDVDGVTATALLVRFLREAGGRVTYYIPHRMTEGYGLQPDHIDRVATKNGVHLIVTVDCGINSFEAVRRAAEVGMDIIVTDHHTPSSKLPEALAVVNPKRADCNACLDHLAGVGMAFYLLILLRKQLREAGYWKSGNEPNLKAFCDLVALGTVADMVPMLGENRAFTRAGIEMIAKGARPGLQALTEVSRLDSAMLDADDIAFRLAPRLNAAGRMDHASAAVELLLTEDRGKASNLARLLDRLNTQRQYVERQMLVEIEAALNATPGSMDRKTIVLSDPGWHEGVIGIAASRTARLHGRPTALFSIRGGDAKGSARSVSGIDLHSVLEACRSEIVAFGGHAMAAGLKVRTDALDRFIERFEAEVSARLPEVPVSDPLQIDAEIDLTRLDRRMLDHFEQLKPFGQENPEPILMAGNLTAENFRTVGERHRRFVLKQHGPGGTGQVPAIEFNCPEDGGPFDRLHRAAFHLRWNRWNGNRHLQAVIRGLDFS
ncbi:MAG: single-stranded-DNA-specific exonuclease RecJ [Desulfobacterales bacterium]